MSENETTPQQAITPESTPASQEVRQSPGRRRFGKYLLGMLVLGAIGAAVGYGIVPTEYESEALIQIAPVLPKILFDTDSNQAMPHFDSYVRTQMELIKSRRVVEMAMQSEAWKVAGGDFTLSELARFEERLSVSRPEETQLVAVFFRDASPERARAGAAAAVNAYFRIYGESDVQRENQRFQILEDRARSLSSQIENLHARRFEELQRVVSMDLETANAMAVRKLERLDLSLEEARQLIELHRHRKANEEASDAEGAADPELKRLLARERELTEAYEEARVHAVRSQQVSLEVEDIERQLERLQESLDLTNSRIEQLSVENAAVSGRLSLRSEAEVPVEPSNTGVRARAAGLGGLVGGLLALVLVSIPRRSRSAGEKA